MDVTQLPFNRLVGLERGADDSEFLVCLPDNPEYTNHLGTVHASALLAVAEAGSGAFLVRQFGSGAEFVPVVRRLEAKFRKPARGRVSARCTVRAEEVEGWSAALADRGRVLAPVSVEVVDADVLVVLSAVVEWFITRAGENAERGATAAAHGTHGSSWFGAVCRVSQLLSGDDYEVVRRDLLRRGSLPSPVAVCALPVRFRHSFQPLQSRGSFHRQQCSRRTAGPFLQQVFRLAISDPFQDHHGPYLAKLFRGKRGSRLCSRILFTRLRTSADSVLFRVASRYGMCLLIQSGRVLSMPPRERRIRRCRDRRASAEPAWDQVPPRV